MRMDLTELENKAARARRGKLEVKVWLVLFVVVLILLVVMVGRMVA